VKRLSYYYSTLLVLALALIVTADLTAISVTIDFDSHLIKIETDHLINYYLLVLIALSSHCFASFHCIAASTLLAHSLLCQESVRIIY